MTTKRISAEHERYFALSADEQAKRRAVWPDMIADAGADACEASYSKKDAAKTLRGAFEVYETRNADYYGNRHPWLPNVEESFERFEQGWRCVADLMDQRAPRMAFERCGSAPKYNFRVLFDGVHIATFVAQSYGRGYYLRDLEGRNVKVDYMSRDKYTKRNLQAETKKEFSAMIARYGDAIPSPQQIEANKQAREEARAEKMRGEQIEESEYQKKKHAAALYEAAREALAYLDSTQGYMVEGVRGMAPLVKLRESIAQIDAAAQAACDAVAQRYAEGRD